jgi:hypothetical protein
MAGRQPQTARCAPKVSPFVKTLALSSVKEEERWRTSNEREKGKGNLKEYEGIGQEMVNAIGGLKQWMDYIGCVSFHEPVLALLVAGRIPELL